MTVSLLLILFFLLIRIPSYLLPRNRLKVYLYSALVACFVIGLIGLIDRIGSASVEDKLGRFFSPMFSFLIDPIKGITVKEAHHVYCYLANSLLYVVSFLLALPVFSFFLVGNNPSIYPHVRWLSRFFLSSLSYLPMASYSLSLSTSEGFFLYQADSLSLCFQGSIL